MSSKIQQAINIYKTNGWPKYHAFILFTNETRKKNLTVA